MKKLFKAILNPSYALQAVQNRVQKRNHRLQEQRWATEDSASIKNIVYWLVGLHLIGAIYHRFKNDGVWESMTPSLKREK